MKRMTPQKIVEKSNMPADLGLSWEQTYAVISESLEGDEFRMMRDGDSLLWMHLTAPHTAETWLLSSAPVEKLPELYANFCAALKRAGYQSFEARTPRRNELLAIKQTGYPVQIQLDASNPQKRVFVGTVTLGQ